MTTSDGNGFKIYPGFIDPPGQKTLVAALRTAVLAAPLFVPAMPRTGKPFSVRMTNLGALGWVSDKDRGYRYQATHPLTNTPWPPIPTAILDIWRQLSGYSDLPEAGLVNYYAAGSRMSLHQDRDELDFTAPVISISLGDDCRFRLGGAKRNDSTRSLRLHSGDVVVLGGSARLAFHGVDRIYPDTSDLLASWFDKGGRVNLTLRRVTPH